MPLTTPPNHNRVGTAIANAIHVTRYVGDTPTDLEIARAAGTPFVAVGRTTDAGAFAALGGVRVWSGVGEWADHLLDGRV